MMTSLSGRVDLTWARVLGSVTAPLVVCIVLRFAVVASDPFGVTGPDAGEYVATAHHLLTHGDFPRFRSSPILPYPLYPLLLAPLLALGQDVGVLLVKCLNIAAGATSVLLACRIARRFSPSHFAPIAGWAIALHPGLVRYAGATSTEALFVPVLLAVILAAARTLEHPTGRRGLEVGSLMAVAALLRPNSAIQSVVVAGVLVAVLLIRKAPQWRPIVAAACAGTLLVAPWTAYLSLKYGELILLSDAWGYAYWDGHHPINARVDDVADPASRERLSSEKHAELRSIRAEAETRGASPQETARLYYEAAEAHIRAGRVSRTAEGWRNVRHLLSFWPNVHVHGRVVAVVFGVYLLPLTVLGTVGLLLALGSSGRWIALMNWLAIGACIALSVIIVGSIRYRFAHIDPLLATATPVGLQWFRRLLSIRSTAH